MKQLPKRSGEYLFEIVMRRYETCTLGDLFKGLKLSGG
jgi:hypothetical protein